MERDAKLNDLIRLKQLPIAPVERWQMVPTLRCSTTSKTVKSDDQSVSHSTSTLQQISANIPKTPENSGRLAMKYKKTPKAMGPSSPPPPQHCKTPKTPGLQYKTPKSSKKTPGRTSNAQTPSSCRFIPSRVTTDIEYSSFLLQKKERKDEEKKEVDEERVDDCGGDSPNKEEYHHELLSALSRSRGIKQRGVLSFKPSTPSVSSSYVEYTENIMDNAENSRTKPKKSSSSMLISTEKILDAPTIVDDYYLNNLDWGKNNHVAIGLGSGVYLWNASDGSVKMLTELSGGQYVSSVSWSSNGKYLAVGGSGASIYLWDVVKEKRIRVMNGHSARVGALAWNKHTVASASQDGTILYNDVRKADHVVGRSCYHQLEVCGLRWSLDGTRLASGANDNLVCIWNSSNPCQPYQILRGHQSAVKAVAWCPWQPNTLATGGGSNDRTIRFWNTYTGQCMDTIDTRSQVSSLAWNKDHKQLLSAHGYPKNHMIVWQYPTMTRVGELTGHSERILHMCLSPRLSRVASAAGDETLRIWKCFERLKCDISQRSYSEESITTLLHSFS